MCSKALRRLSAANLSAMRPCRQPLPVSCTHEDRLHAQAQADLDGIVDYYKPLNPYALAKIYAEVTGDIALIAQFPRAGRQQKPKKVRKVVVRK